MPTTLLSHSNLRALVYLFEGLDPEIIKDTLNPDCRTLNNLIAGYETMMITGQAANEQIRFILREAEKRNII